MESRATSNKEVDSISTVESTLWHWYVFNTKPLAQSEVKIAENILDARGIIVVWHVASLFLDAPRIIGSKNQRAMQDNEVSMRCGLIVWLFIALDIQIKVQWTIECAYSASLDCHWCIWHSVQEGRKILLCNCKMFYSNLISRSVVNRWVLHSLSSQREGRCIR